MRNLSKSSGLSESLYLRKTRYARPVTGRQGGKLTISLLVLLAICFSGLPAEAKYGGGSGTAEDPYLIFMAEQMNAIGANPDDWHKHFKLMADIDLGSYSGDAFNIIGYCSYPDCNPFTGVFDGNRYTISNFTYTSTHRNGVGLFAVIGENAEIKDLGLIDPDVDAGAGDFVGSLVGSMGRGNNITVCYVEGGSVEGDESVGGLVGGNGGTISNCYSTGSVLGDKGVGGLVGSNGGTITNCYSTGSVSGRNFVGGLLGADGSFLYGGLISDCYATGRVSGNDATGGLMGAGAGTTITSCYATGTVSGNANTGGLVGDQLNVTMCNCYATGSVSGTTNVGGLVGHNTSLWLGTITNCYSTGSVSGTGWYVGGLVGYNEAGEITDSFWDTETSGQPSSDGGTGKTIAEMQTMSTFTDAGWDFDNVWDIVEGQTYPFLRGVGGEPSLDWLKVANTPLGIWTLRKEAGIQAEVLMIVPNDWVLKLVSENSQTIDKDGYIWWEVENAGDGVAGWMAARKSDGSQEYLVPGDLEKAEELDPAEEPQQVSETVPAIVEAVHHYYNNDDIAPSLYSSDNSDNSLSMFKDAGFPIELVLAIIAQESRGTWGRQGGQGGDPIYTAFNNALRTWDDGYGIMQITTLGFKGRGSHLDVYEEECAEFRRVWIGNYTSWFPEHLCNWYTNTRQGIYANIKDGLRALQDKYATRCPAESIIINGFELTCHDIEKILAVWGYNGFARDRATGEYTGSYLVYVADNLANLDLYFPGWTYGNADNLIEKLVIANDNKEIVKLYSPGELYVVDATGSITGVLDGQTYQEIQNSVYDSVEEAVMVLFPSAPFVYNVRGTDEGEYGLRISSIEEGQAVTFTAINIPTSSEVTHQYTVDWEALSVGEEGVSLDIDSDGDGIFEQTVIADNDLTHDEFALQTETVIDFDPDTLNLKSKGKFVTVYIELPEGFIVREIDISSLSLNDSVSALSKPVEIGDYDSDGIGDLMVKFDRQKLIQVLAPGKQRVTLRGRLNDRTPLTGIDVIRLIH